MVSMVTITIFFGKCKDVCEWRHVDITILEEGDVSLSCK